jgi:hypothetical protein
MAALDGRKDVALEHDAVVAPPTAQRCFVVTL